MSLRLVATGLTLVLVIVGCSDSSEPTSAGDETTTSVPAATSTEAPPTTSTASSTISTVAGPPYEYEFIRDVEYQESHPPSNEPLVDIYAPDAPGPLPVAVLYHPFSVVNDKSSMSGLAGDLAEAGVVVFNVSYGATTIADYTRVSQLQGACSYWYVAEHAAEYGGNPDDVTLVGFSGGANTAMALTVFPPDETAGCYAVEAPVDPSAVVLLEGDWLLAEWWDDSIREDPTFYERWTVWGYIDSYAGYPVHLIVDDATRGVYSYTISEKRIDAFLELRDSDGSKRADLEELGAFDDGAVDLVEFSELFHLRLQRAGHPTTLTSIDSRAHSMTVEAREAIVNLVTGTSDG